MATNRKRISRKKIEELPADRKRMMMDKKPEDTWEIFFPVKQEEWTKHRELILSEWIKTTPGTRPNAWWKFDAPGNRDRIDMSENKQHYANFNYGVPSYWNHEIDQANPPTYESQATFLKRHDLLTPQEKRRLKSADFEPEVVC